MMGYILKFVDFDSSENGLGDAIHTVRIPIEADSIQEAKEEASAMWKRCVETRRKTGWDKRTYPREPSLVLEIDWEP